MTTTDAALAAAAGTQLGLTTHRQLAALGLSHEQIANRLERGVLRSIHQGVYRHAAAPWTSDGRIMAAVLASGAGAAASHRSAAALHRRREVPRWRPEVTLQGTRLPLLRGVTVHRTEVWGPGDLTSVDRNDVHGDPHGVRAEITGVITGALAPHPRSLSDEQCQERLSRQRTKGPRVDV